MLTSLAALGVVFGDIGTSPLYALKECFGEYGIIPTEGNVLGILSLIFWTVVSSICIKYMVFIMRADNRGEGGTLSLMTLVIRSLKKQSQGRQIVVMTSLGLIGAALIFGDGIITPAISILSAMEGIELVAPELHSYIIPLSIPVVCGLFLMQRFGTSKIGVVFGPILLLWFSVLGILGLRGVLGNPHVLLAVDPTYGLQFLLENGWAAFFVLGSVFLVVTGGEALYADMGHFGKQPIRIAWFSVAFPALVLNYFGQGALILQNSAALKNPFYELVPEWALLPMVGLSTIATVIASQALITGIFSLTRQAIQLGFCPRINIIHTSKKEIGQIYIPFVNWLLFIGVLWLIVTFKSSSNLAAAYGIAVTAATTMTTLLAFEVARVKWGWSLLKSTMIFGTFIVIDIIFFASNIHKIPHGGWVPLVVGAVVYLMMTTWQKGRQILYRRLKARSMPIEEFCLQILKDPPIRAAGTAMYLSGDPWGVPAPLLHNLKHNKVLHQRIGILTIQTKEIPSVPQDERISIQEIMPNFFRIIVMYGFMETPKMSHILEACRKMDIHFDVQETTFVLGRETIIPRKAADKNDDVRMAHWREKIFAVMTKNAQRPTAFFKIPVDQVIEVGIQVEI